MSNPEKSVVDIKEYVGICKIDYLIYNVGIWEQQAFTADYDFSQSSTTEILAIIQTNITSCILHIQAFLDNLKKAENAKIILIGSTWGLDNHNGKEVVFSASKFAIRGILHGLRESTRSFNIGGSVLNLGFLATEYGCEKSKEEIIDLTAGALIPLHDLIAAVRFILSTSSNACDERYKCVNHPFLEGPQ